MTGSVAAAIHARTIGRRAPGIRRQRHMAQVAARSSSRHGEQQTVVVNQPIERVVAFMSSADWMSGQPCSAHRALDAEADEMTADYELLRTYTIVGRTTEICYQCYPVPGGTQVTARMQAARPSPFDVAAARAAGSCTRRIEAALRRLKEVLE